MLLTVHLNKTATSLTLLMKHTDLKKKEPPTSILSSTDQVLSKKSLNRVRSTGRSPNRGKSGPMGDGVSRSPISRYASAFQRAGRFSIDKACGWCVVFKVRLLLVLLLVLPAIAVLAGLETHPQDMRNYVAIGLVAGVMLLAPLSKLIAHFLILKELKAVEAFCLRLKGGDYSFSFDLPDEQDEEHELLILKRNLNWMAHVISRREFDLQRRLKQTAADRMRYENMSMLDPLTGLFNRRGLELKLAEMTREAHVAGRPLSLMFLDADKFKEVNDTYGHDAGDELLRNLGRILQNNVREGVDVPFRYGGDEFGVLFVDFGVEKAVIIGERILHGARILALADSLSAMMENRTYRQSLTPDEALDELRQGGGSQFDPQICALMIRMLQAASFNCPGSNVQSVLPVILKHQKSSRRPPECGHHTPFLKAHLEFQTKN